MPSLVAALLLLLVLPNLAGPPLRPGGVLPVAPAPAASGRIVVAPGFSTPREARDLGALPGTSPIQVLVGLADRDPGGLAARIALSETPGNPLYGHYLTPAELRSEYGPSTATVRAAVAYFDGNGLSATVSADGALLRVSGPSTAVGAAFQTTFDRYAVGSRIVFSHPSPASLPAGVPWTGVLGLGNTTPIRPLVGPGTLIGPVDPSVGCPSGSPYVPCEVLRAYNGSSFGAGGVNGSGYRVAVVDAYDSAEPQNQLASDLASFETQNGLPHQNVSFVYPVPTSTNLNASAASGWGTEEALDLEWARGMAPGAAVDMVLAPNASVTLYYAVDWLVAHDTADVISLSWGEPDVGIYDPSAGCPDQCNATTDGSYTLLHPVLEAAAAEGIGVFAATGDCGAAGGTLTDATDFPSSDPYVTAVGAT
ncbi:MAG TPA: protease pro-enzyme activation domain-containing protein, partial [Thermoplasmata archaeon]|nr:protease pro-enzyme activation domain-containing protein [Thermoplasmata archaeon]